MSFPSQFQVSGLSPHDPSNFYSKDYASTVNFGNNVNSGFNQDFFNKIRSAGLTENVTDPLEMPGIEGGLQVDTYAFGRYLGLLPNQFAKNSGYFGDILKNNDRNDNSTFFSFGDLNSIGGIGATLQYIPEENGDQMRMFGTRMFDTDSTANYRFYITQGMIDAYNLENGTNLTYIPAESTSLVLDADPTSGYNPNYLQPMIDMCSRCGTGANCGRSIRLLYIQKKSNYTQGLTCRGNVTEVMGVFGFTRISQTGIKLQLRRGMQGETQTDNSSNGIKFDFGSQRLEVGDVVFVGTEMPTTDCLPKSLSCSSFQPKQYVFCDTIREFSDCAIGCISKRGFATRQFNQIMDYKEQLTYAFAKQVRTFYHRVMNDLFHGSALAYQGQPMPSYGGQPARADEIIPFGTNGIFNLHNTHSKKMLVPLKGCTDACAGIVMEALINAMDRGTGGEYRKEYRTNKPGYLWVGDVESLNKIFAAGMANKFIPNSLQGAKDQMALQQGVYSMRKIPMLEVSDPELQAYFDNIQENDMDLEFYEIDFGGIKMRALHDEDMARNNPGNMKLFHIPSIRFFTDSTDKLISKAMGSNPWLPATAVEGSIIPSVYSNDYGTTMINGKEMSMAKDNCSISMGFYMRLGVRFAPAKLPYLWEVQFVGQKPNPNFGQPGQPAFLTVSILDLGCGCVGVEQQIMRNLERYSEGFSNNQATTYNIY